MSFTIYFFKIWSQHSKSIQNFISFPAPHLSCSILEQVPLKHLFQMGYLTVVETLPLQVCYT